MREHPAGPTSKSELSPPLFEIRTVEEGEGVVVLLKGELDLFERPKFEQAMEAAEANHGGRILLDLGELTFIDAAGLGALLTAGHRSTHNGNLLRITEGRGDVAALFRLTGLDMTLPFVTVEAGTN